MQKFICNECIGSDYPCVLTTNEEAIVPSACPYQVERAEDRGAKWSRVVELKEIKQGD